jgi:hypothetical protein
MVRYCAPDTIDVHWESTGELLRCVAFCRHPRRNASSRSRQRAHDRSGKFFTVPCISTKGKSVAMRYADWRVASHELNKGARRQRRSRLRSTMSACSPEPRRCRSWSRAGEQASSAILSATPLGDGLPALPSNSPVDTGIFLATSSSGRSKRRYTMISAWWLVLAFLVGAYSGVLVMAIMSAARDVAKQPVRRAAVRAHLRRTAADAP